MTHVELCRLDPGYIVNQQDKKWKVVGKLGEGSFGAVYMVQTDDKDKTLAAMKIESHAAKNQVIKMEVAVLRRLRGKRHAVEFYACGRIPERKVNFLIMGMVGENLSRLRRRAIDRRFSTSTTVRLGLQGIEAIEELHSTGFLHRDIKPGNMAMGRIASKARILYILDFGLARQFTDVNGNLKPPRVHACFRGTVRYASLECHRSQELGRGDDLVSLLYCLIEFLRPDLPWRKLDEKDEVMKMKESIAPAELYKNCPINFQTLMKALEGLKYANTPDYESYKVLMKNTLATEKVKETTPYDWEPGGRSHRPDLEGRVRTCGSTHPSEGAWIEDDGSEDEDPTEPPKNEMNPDSE